MSVGDCQSLNENMAESLPDVAAADKDPIRITHYINPHLFWFKYESSFLKQDKVNAELADYAYQNHRKLGYEPTIDECVGILHIQWNKWVRARVDDILVDISQTKKFVLWLWDEGVPLITSSKHIIPLPKELASKKSSQIVKFAGISGLLPRGEEYDFLESRKKIKILPDWQSSAVDCFEKLILDSAEIIFNPIYKSDNNQLFGELFYHSHEGHLVNIKTPLLLMSWALEQPLNQFKMNLLKGQTLNIKRWQNNQRNSVSLKSHQNRGITEAIESGKIVVASQPTASAKRYLVDDNAIKKVADWQIKNDEHIVLPTSPSTHGVDNLDDSASCENNYISDLKSNDKLVLNKKQPDVLINTDGKSSDSQLQHISPSEIDEEQFMNIAGIKRTQRGKDGDLRLPYQKSITITQPKEEMKNSTSQCNIAPTKKPTTAEKLIRKINQAKVVNNSSISEPPIIAIPAGYPLNKLDEFIAQNASPILNKNINFEDDSPLDASKEVQSRHSRKHFNVNKYKTKATESVYKNNQNYDNYKAQETQFTKAVEKESCIVNNLYGHRVLVHGKRVTPPVDSLQAANFSTTVVNQLLDRRFKDIYRIQAYGWPHIMRGGSFICVSYRGTGKTYAYLPAVCSLSMMNLYKEEGVGPVSLIVCGSGILVTEIEIHCKNFFDDKLKHLVAATRESDDKNNFYAKLAEGCAILITTPKQLLNLFYDKDLKLINLKRLERIIFDDIDRFLQDIKGIMTCLESYKAKKFQVISTSRIWHPILSNFFTYANAVLCIGAYIEAAVYGRCQLSLHITESKRKGQEIMNYILSVRNSCQRIAIVCNSNEEVDEIVDLLKQNVIVHQSCDQRCSANDIDGVRHWLTLLSPHLSVFVCTDSVMPEIQFDVSILIHYSLPNSWSKFTYRFSVLFHNYRDALKEADAQHVNNCGSLIYLDENNNDQLPKLVEFLSRIGCIDIPKEVEVLAQRIRIETEKQRYMKNRQFCENILQFGKCLNELECSSRHLLTHYDQVDVDIPLKGEIKFEILHIHTPVHYSVRLYEYKSRKNRTWKQYPQAETYSSNKLRLISYFSNKQNHRIHYPICIGDRCAIYEHSQYYRCEIIQEIVPSYKGKPSILRLKLIDEGIFLTLNSDKLLYLPNEICEFPAEAVDIRIANLIPNNCDMKWPMRTLNTVKKWFELHKGETMHLEAAIKITLMRSIWVHTVNLNERLITIFNSILVTSIRKSLLNKKLAVEDDLVLINIQRLANNAGIFRQNLTTYTSNGSAEELKFTEKDEINLNSSKEVVENEFSYYSGERNEDITSTTKETSVLATDISPYSHAQTISNINTNDPILMIKTNMMDINLSTSVDEFKPEEDSFEQVSPSANPMRGRRIMRKPLKKNRPKQFFDQNSDTIPSSSTSISSKNSSALDSRSSISISNNIERWEEINELNHYQNVCIPWSTSPSEIFIQKVSNSEALKVLFDEIDTYIDQNSDVKMKRVKIGMNCLAKINGSYNRAKIIRVDSNVELNPLVDVFFTDLGNELAVAQNELLTIPDYLIHCLPFQIICCSMIGIQEITNITEYDEFDNVLSKFENVFVYCLNMTSETNSNFLRYNKYDAIFVDCSRSDDLCLNRYIVTKGLAQYNPQNEHLLASFKNSLESLTDAHQSDSEEENWNDYNYVRPPVQETNAITTYTNLDDEALANIDFQFTEDELLQMFSNTASPLGNIQNKQIDNKMCEVPTMDNEVKKSDNEDASLQSSKLVKPNLILLKNTTKIPKVKWQQSESVICLEVAAPEVAKYNLKLTSQTLELRFFQGDEEYSLLINLFGAVNTDWVAHEIRGLHINIKFKKISKNFIWPRLTFNNDKSNGILYNFDAIQLIDENNEKYYESNLFARQSTEFMIDDDFIDHEFSDEFDNSDVDSDEEYFS